MEPFESVTEPRPAGSDTTSVANSGFGVALPAGRGSVFIRSYMPSTKPTPRGGNGCYRVQLTTASGSAEIVQSFRHIVREHAIDIVQLGPRDGFLRLHNLNVVGHTGIIPLAGQFEIFFRHLKILRRNLHLAPGRLQVQVHFPDIGLYLPA